MSLLKTNEIQNYNGSSLTLTASTVSTSAQLNTGGNISVTGSLNVSDDSTTRTNLGLGTIATQDSNNVSVTGGSLTGTEIDLKSSGTTIYKSDGTTAVLSESGGVVTLNNGTLGSGVVFPALGNSAVGTVSESSGTPTGDIVERGSNANGEFVKFADGTLICTFNSSTVASFAISAGYGSLYVGTEYFTLPATYVNKNYVVSCRVQYATSGSWSQGYAYTTTVVAIRAWDIVSRDGSLSSSVDYLTIGKWY